MTGPVLQGPENNIHNFSQPIGFSSSSTDISRNVDSGFLHGRNNSEKLIGRRPAHYAQYPDRMHSDQFSCIHVHAGVVKHHDLPSY